MPTAPPPPSERPKRRTAAGGTPSGTGTNGTSDTAPRRGGAGPGSSGQGPAARKPTTPKLQASLEDLFAAPALAYSMAGDQWAAEFVAERAPVLAKAWADLANESPAVKRVLTRLTTGSAWGGVIAASTMTALPLLAHHNLLPPQIAGAFSEGDANGGPIVPPPPAPSGPPPGGRTSPPGNGGGGMTPPLRDDQPPGVVTVAGTGAVIS